MIDLLIRLKLYHITAKAIIHQASKFIKKTGQGTKTIAKKTSKILTHKTVVTSFATVVTLDMLCRKDEERRQKLTLSLLNHARCTTRSLHLLTGNGNLGFLGLSRSGFKGFE